MIPPGTIVPFRSGTCPLTKTRSPNLVPPERVLPTAPRWVISLFLRSRLEGAFELRGEAVTLVMAKREVRSPRLKSIVRVGAKLVEARVFEWVRDEDER